MQGSEIDWKSDPPPFSNLPEDALGTILHFLYSECLPDNLNEPTARLVINAATQHACLNKLASLCKLYLKNMALKQRMFTISTSWFCFHWFLIDSQKSSTLSMTCTPVWIKSSTISIRETTTPPKASPRIRENFVLLLNSRSGTQLLRALNYYCYVTCLRSGKMNCRGLNGTKSFVMQNRDFPFF